MSNNIKKSIISSQLQQMIEEAKNIMQTFTASARTIQTRKSFANL